MPPCDGCDTRPLRASILASPSHGGGSGHGAPRVPVSCGGMLQPAPAWCAQTKQSPQSLLCVGLWVGGMLQPAPAWCAQMCTNQATALLCTLCGALWRPLCLRTRITPIRHKPSGRQKAVVAAQAGSVIPACCGATLAAGRERVAGDRRSGTSQKLRSLGLGKRLPPCVLIRTDGSIETRSSNAVIKPVITSRSRLQPQFCILC